MVKSVYINKGDVFVGGNTESGTQFIRQSLKLLGFNVSDIMVNKAKEYKFKIKKKHIRE